MTTPTIHVSPEEFGTERMWIEHLAPIARDRGIPAPTALLMDHGDPSAHHWVDEQGVIVATVRTDRPACPKCGR